MSSPAPFLLPEKLSLPSSFPPKLLPSQECNELSAQKSISITSPDFIHTASHSFSPSIIPVKHNTSICTFHISCSPKHSTTTDSSAELPKSAALPNPIPSSPTTCSSMSSAHHQLVVGEVSQVITGPISSSVNHRALPHLQKSPEHTVKDIPSEMASFSSTSFFPSRRPSLEYPLPLPSPMRQGEHPKRCDMHTHDGSEGVSVSDISPTGDLSSHPPCAPCPSSTLFTGFVSSSFIVPSSVTEDENRRMKKNALRVKEGGCSAGEPLLRTFLCQMDPKCGQKNEPMEEHETLCKSVFKNGNEEKYKVEDVFASDIAENEASQSLPKVRKSGRQSDAVKDGVPNTRVQCHHTMEKEECRETTRAHCIQTPPRKEEKETTMRTPHSRDLATTAADTSAPPHVGGSIGLPCTPDAERERCQRTPHDERSDPSFFFPSLQAEKEWLQCDPLSSTPSMNLSLCEHHDFDNDEEQLFFRRDSVQGLDVLFEDEGKNANEEEEEEKRILAAIGASNEEEEEEEIEGWEDDARQACSVKAREEHRVMRATATCAAAKDTYRHAGASLFKKERLTDTVLHRLLGCHRLERVTRAAFRMDVRQLDGVERLCTLLPSLIALRLNSSWIPSTRCLGIRYVHLKVLWLNRCHLNDLLGIGALAPALTELYVAFNHISDLSPLLGVSTTLEVLDVEGNRIKDVASLSFVLKSLTKAHMLTLQGNPAEEEEVSAKMLYTSSLVSTGARWREPEEKHEIEGEKTLAKQTGLPPLSTTPTFSFFSLPRTAGATDSTATTSASATNDWTSFPASRSPPTLSDAASDGAPQQEVKDLQDVFGGQNPFLRFRQWVQHLMPWLQYLDDIPTLRCCAARSSAEVEGGKDTTVGGEKNKSNESGPEDKHMKVSAMDHTTVSCSGEEDDMEDISSHAMSPTPPCLLLSTALHPPPSPSSLRMSSPSPSSFSSHPFRRFSFPLQSPFQHMSSAKVEGENETLPTKNGFNTPFMVGTKERMIRESSCAGLESDSPAVREELRFLQDCVREHGSDAPPQTLLEQNEGLYASRPFTSFGTKKPRTRSAACLGTFPFTETTAVNGTKKQAQKANAWELPSLFHSPFSPIPGMKPTHVHRSSVGKNLETSPVHTMTETTETTSSIPRHLGLSCEDRGNGSSSSSSSSSSNPFISNTLAREEQRRIKRAFPPCPSASCPYTLGEGETNEKRVWSGHYVSSPSPRNEWVTSVRTREENKAKREEKGEEEEEEEWDRLRATLLRRKLLNFSERYQERATAWNLPTQSNGKTRMRNTFNGYLNSSVLDPSLLSCMDVPNVSPSAALSSSSSALVPGSRATSGQKKRLENHLNHVRNGWPYVLSRSTLPNVEQCVNEPKTGRDDSIERKEEEVGCKGGKEDEKNVQQCPEILLLKMLKMKKERHSHHRLWKDVSSKPQILTEVDEEKDFNTFLKEEVGRTKAQIARNGVGVTTFTSASSAAGSLRHIRCMRECKREEESNTKMGRRSSSPHNAVLFESESRLTNSTHSCSCRDRSQSVHEMDFFANESNFEVVDLGGLEHFLT